MSKGSWSEALSSLSPAHLLSSPFTAPRIHPGYIISATLELWGWSSPSAVLRDITVMELPIESKKEFGLGVQDKQKGGRRDEN